jgi:AcrR family transcriptional regulator
MQVSRQDPRANQRNRTRSALIRGANDLMRMGKIPSVAEAAEAAAVSRATAYRYFPNQASLLESALKELTTPLGPEATAGITDPEDFINFGVDKAIELLQENEAQFRAVLRLSLEQWARRRAGEPESDRPVLRGGRIPIVEAGLSGIRDKLDGAEFRRLAIALSLLFGIETLIVLKDIWRLDDAEAKDVLRWTGLALVRSTLGQRGSETNDKPETNSTR